MVQTVAVEQVRDAAAVDQDFPSEVRSGRPRWMHPALAFALVALLWGVSWLAIKTGFDELAPIWSASLRFFFASAILLAIAVFRFKCLPRTRRVLAVVLAVGVIMFGFGFWGTYWGAQHIPSGLTAVLYATVPLWIGLLAVALTPNDTWSYRQGLGAAFGIAGLAVIFHVHLRVDGDSLVPMVSVLLGTAGTAIGTLVIRRWGQDIPIVFLSGSAMMVAAIVLLVISRLYGESQILPQTGAGWASVLYLAIGVSVVSFGLYFWLLRAWTAHRTGMVAVLSPAIAVMLGTVFLREPLSVAEVGGILMVLAGVGVAVTKKSGH